MTKRNIFLYLLVSLFFIVVVFRLSQLMFVDKDHYEKLLKEKTEIYIYGASAPRGKILDSKGRVIVDNIGVKTISYHKLDDVTTSEELEIARKLAKNLELEEEISDVILKEYYLAKYPDETKKLITDKEYQMLEERKITLEEIKKLKL